MADIFKNANFDLDSTAITLVYTVPSDSRAIIKNVQTTNSGANAIVTVTANDGSTSFNTSITSLTTNTHANLIDAPVVLIESETLSIQSDVANAVSGIVSILEISRN